MNGILTEKFEKFIYVYTYIYKIKKNCGQEILSKKEKESRLAEMHWLKGAGKMSMRFNQDKCCET